MTHSFPTRRSSDRGEGALDVERPHRAGNQQHRGAGQCDDVGAYLVPDQRRDDRGEDEQGQDLVDRHVRPASRTRRRVVNAPGYDSTFGSTTQTPRAAIRSEEHTSELQSLMRISYAVFCLKKKNT